MYQLKPGTNTINDESTHYQPDCYPDSSSLSFKIDKHWNFIKYSTCMLDYVNIMYNHSFACLSIVLLWQWKLALVWIFPLIFLKFIFGLNIHACSYKNTTKSKILYILFCCSLMIKGHNSDREICDVEVTRSIFRNCQLQYSNIILFTCIYMYACWCHA